VNLIYLRREIIGIKDNPDIANTTGEKLLWWYGHVQRIVDEMWDWTFSHPRLRWVPFPWTWCRVVGGKATDMLTASCWCLTWLIFGPWTWKQLVLPNISLYSMHYTALCARKLQCKGHNEWAPMTKKGKENQKQTGNKGKCIRHIRVQLR
jgi:hypothetical protein